ncbi:MAG: hypothetical protein SGCHY_005646, partial [Lobulomycetales sp.]
MFNSTPFELVAILDKCPVAVARRLHARALELRIPCSSVLGLDHRFLRTGLQLLDDAMQGGLPLATITEIVGSPGTGKTQLLFQIAGNVVAEKNGAVLWIDTEGSFHAHRLLEIVLQKHDDPSLEARLLDCVRLCQVDSLSSLASLVHRMTPLWLTGVKCIVIDSIACLSRSEDSSRIQAASTIQAVIRNLKKLANQLGIWVIVSNQMTTARASAADTHTRDPADAVFVTTPALGNTWHHNVNTRIRLEMEGELDSDKIERRLCLEKSPQTQSLCFAFTIDEK